MVLSVLPHCASTSKGAMKVERPKWQSRTKLRESKTPRLEVYGVSICRDTWVQGPWNRGPRPPDEGFPTSTKPYILGRWMSRVGADSACQDVRSIQSHLGSTRRSIFRWHPSMHQPGKAGRRTRTSCLSSSETHKKSKSKVSGDERPKSKS